MAGWFKDRLPELDEEIEHEKQLIEAGTADNPFRDGSVPSNTNPFERAVFDEDFEEVVAGDMAEDGTIDLTPTGRSIPTHILRDEQEVAEIAMVNSVFSPRLRPPVALIPVQARLADKAKE